MSLRLKALVFRDTDTQVALLLAFQVLPCVNLRGLVPHQASFLREPALKSCLIKPLLNNPHITGSLRNYRRFKWAQL